jgi:hypothetical protein
MISTQREESLRERKKDTAFCMKYLLGRGAAGLVEQF